MAANEIRYVPALTGLRGVAAWWVVLYHFSDPLHDVVPSWVLALIGRGYLAVDLFFILSGYVIYLTSGKSLENPGRRVISKFMLNRLVRIYPLHLVMMFFYLLNPLALWLFSSAGVDDGRYGLGYYAASIFLIQNWGGFDYLQWNIPAWSISTEFAAYILCPLLIAIGVSPCVGRKWGLAALMTLLAWSIGFIFKISGEQSIGGSIPSIGLIRCVLEFWIGLCLGGICRNTVVMSDSKRLLHTGGILFVVAASSMLFYFEINDYWFIPLSFAFLIYMLSAGDVLFSKILAINGIHYLGLISYSTYLVHFFVKDWVKFLSESIGLIQWGIYLAVCLLASICLYRYVEEPARRIFRMRLMGVL